MTKPQVTALRDMLSDIAGVQSVEPSNDVELLARVLKAMWATNWPSDKAVDHLRGEFGINLSEIKRALKFGQTYFNELEK